MRHRSSRPDRKYAAIPNHILRDEAMSMEARGLLALLMTYSDDWVFSRAHLMKVTGWGRDKFQRAMRELIGAGYVERVESRSDGGKLSGTTWVIHDDPTESLKTRSSVSTEGLKNRPPVKPTAGKSGPLRRPTEKEDQIERKDLFGSHEPPSSSQKDAQNNDEAFDRFWNTYPRKVKKPAAIKSFKAAIKKSDAEQIIRGAKAYADLCRKNGTEQNYIAHPSSWLNQERWNDEMPGVQKSTGNPEADKLERQADLSESMGSVIDAVLMRAKAAMMRGAKPDLDFMRRMARGERATGNAYDADRLDRAISKIEERASA